jgi:hypothetical protein
MHSQFNVFVAIHIVEYSLKLNETSSHKNMFKDVISALRHVLNVKFDHPIRNPFSLMTLNVLISFVTKNKVLQCVLHESNYYHYYKNAMQFTSLNHYETLKVK